VRLIKSVGIGVLASVGAAIGVLVLLATPSLHCTVPTADEGGSWDCYAPVRIDYVVVFGPAIAAGFAGFVWQWQRGRPTGTPV
jgi:hypothetical protein